MIKKQLIIALAASLLTACEPQIMQYRNNQSTPLTSNPGDKEEKGDISKNDTIIFGKIKIVSSNNEDITKHCAVQFINKIGHRSQKIYSSLYGRQYFLGSYSNTSEEGLYAAKISPGEVKLSFVDCANFRDKSFYDVVNRKITAVRYQFTATQERQKYYFGDIFIKINGNDYDIKDNYAQDLELLHNSIPNSKLLPTKNVTSKKQILSLSQIIKDDKKRIEDALKIIKKSSSK